MNLQYWGRFAHYSKIILSALLIQRNHHRTSLYFASSPEKQDKGK